MHHLGVHFALQGATGDEEGECGESYAAVEEGILAAGAVCWADARWWWFDYYDWGLWLFMFGCCVLWRWRRGLELGLLLLPTAQVTGGEVFVPQRHPCRRACWRGDCAFCLVDDIGILYLLRGRASRMGRYICKNSGTAFNLNFVPSPDPCTPRTFFTLAPDKRLQDITAISHPSSSTLPSGFNPLATLSTSGIVLIFIRLPDNLVHCSRPREGQGEDRSHVDC